jgi:predicted ATPase/DNA-binding CsgD family transcriptional regulator
MSEFQLTQPGTLPTPTTSFLGRTRELETAVGLLRRPEVRLLTITGPGGIGKTRLAQRIVDVQRDSYPDGAVVLSLAPLHDPAFALLALAQILAIREAAGQDLLDRVAQFLADRQALLVVDNAERLLDGVGHLVAHLVTTCPRLTVLCTSRTRLGISAEHVFPLSALRPSDARQLFASRARAQLPDFVLTDDAAAVVDAICARLDRLPLAIELAAPRIAMLSPTALLSRLDRPLDALSDGPRDAPDRQRTLRDTIAWSYDLLHEDERQLFHRLGVFVGGFSLEAAAAVAGAGGDVFRGISALVDASLVVPTIGVGDAPRFTMLETIREFALERLTASGDEPAVRDHHAAYYLGFAEKTDWSWFVALPEGEIRLARLQAEEANLRAALRWFDRQKDYASLLRLAGNLGGLWVIRGHAREGQRWLEKALALGSTASDAVRAKALATLSSILKATGEADSAFARAEEGLAICRTRNDPLSTWQCLLQAGVGAQLLGNYDYAVARYEEGLTATSSDEPPEAAAHPELMQNMHGFFAACLGWVALYQGAFERAEEWYQVAYRQLRDSGNQNGQSYVMAFGILAGLGDVARAKGDPANAFEFYRTSVTMGMRDRNAGAICHGLSGVAGSLAALSLHEPAARLFGACESIHISLGYSFERDAFGRQRALGLPEPWARNDDPPSAYLDLHRALAGKHPLPPIRDPAAIAAQWAAGRNLTLDEAIAEALAVQVDAVLSPAASHGLSPRESEVLRFLAEGDSNRRIAERLSLSERTVDHHVLSILTKLGLESRTAAAVWAVRHEMV